MDAGVGLGLEVDTGLSAGSGYVNGEFQFKMSDNKKGRPRLFCQHRWWSRRRRTICFGFRGDR